MAIQSQPSRISEPFAGSGTKNVIPATNATPSASQAASWASGFPPECSQPISAGGCPVPRDDMNGVLNWISQGLAYQQDGGIWEWSALADYDASRVVRGSDGQLYWSVAQSGPGVVAGAQDPTADDGTYWTAVPVDNADVVHKSGDETITGMKTLLGNVNGGYYTATEFVMCIPDVELASDTALPPEKKYASIQFTDKTGAIASGVAVIDSFAPTSTEEHFEVSLRMRALGSYVGGTYTSTPDLRLKSFPDGGGYVDTNSFMVHGEHPTQVFRCTGAPAKGTYPSTSRKCTVYFMDDSEGVLWDDGNHRYGSLEQEINSSGSTALNLMVYKNVTNSSDYLQVQLVVWSNGASAFQPNKNGETLLGNSGLRWGQIYSSSATISTSDARLKSEPESMPDEVLDAWGDVAFVQFQMLDSIKKKGAEAARLHSGLIAQRIDEAFKARGLDASRYGLFCYDEWEAEPEERDENGSVVRQAREAGSCYSLRYEEALCMEAAYQRRRADRAESRLAALEERLAVIESKLG